MTQPTPKRPRLKLEKVATMLAIVVCALASVWLGRDLVYGGTPPRVVATTRAPAPTRPPVRTAPPLLPLPTEPVSLAGAAIKGSPQAKVALVIYSDFECPFCARFANDTWPTLGSKYVGTEKVQAAFRHLPIEQIHSSALKAAEATECAAQQSQFWPMHDVLFKNTKQLGEMALLSYAQQIRLDLPNFRTCLNGMTTAKIRADAAAASALGITGTPAFFVGAIQPDGRVKVTERIAGARPIATFEAAIDRALATSVSGTK